MLSHVGFDIFAAIVDRCRSVTFRYLHLVFGNCGKDLCAERTRNLHGDVSDTASSCMYENSLSGMDLGAIHQTLPSSDKNERQRRSLSHRKIRRLYG